MSAVAEAPEPAARILIVDDEQNDRNLLELLLAAEGFVVQSASSGDEALAILTEHPPDLILLDVMMPDMDGYQLVEKIKRHSTAGPIPIIMVTVLDDRQAMMRALAAGAQDYLVKPVNRAELYIRVRNLLHLKAYGDNQGKYSQSLEREVGWREADLVESEELYRTTFDAAPVGIVRASMTGRWLHVNQRLCDLLGYSREELRDDAVQDLIRCQEQAGQDDASVRMASGSLDRHVVDAQRYRRSDGSFIWVRVVVSVRRDATGKAQEIISVIEDITDRRLLEAQVQQSVAHLTASEQRYRALLENAKDAIAVLTPAGIVREMNQRWAEIVGVPRDQLIGRHVSQFVTSDQPADDTAFLGAGAASSDSPSAAVKIATGSGLPLLLEFSSSSIEVAGEQLVLTIGRDVTQQGQLEERLRQAQKLEVIGQLAGGVAHDFNNILTAILGFCEFLLADLPPDDCLRTDVLEIKSAGDRGASLVRQLLAFSRKQILHSSILNMNGVIEGMEPMLRRLIPAHVDLVFSLQPDVGAIDIDPSQLEQIVINLLVNGADAMARGGKLTIETANVRLDERNQRHHPRIAPGDYVMLAVSDTGIGMDEATIRHVFEPFFTTKEVGKGTGLGLATVHGIVKQSGGDIWVDSKLGHGSVFKVYLPLVTSGASVALRAEVESGNLRRGSETILLVEDDEAVCRMACLVLERAGYRVIEAGNPREALRLANEDGRAINLLLSDIVMPESEGPPLFERLAKLQPGVRVLYMSGYADEAVVRHGVIVEGTPFLQKPFTPQALCAKVRDVLDAAPAATEPTMLLRPELRLGAPATGKVAVSEFNGTDDALVAREIDHV